MNVKKEEKKSSKKLNEMYFELKFKLAKCWLWNIKIYVCFSKKTNKKKKTLAVGQDFKVT